ncbi:MAG: hypothetical protein H6550_16615, partial [Chitinophagales bacterium]|nr:hypothetical protein [Chitinophagales bacterium]
MKSADPSSDNDAGLPNHSSILTNGPDAVCATYNGSLDVGDATQNFRPWRDGVASVCGPPKSCTAGLSATGSYYDVYTFANTSCNEICVTVSFTSGHASGFINFVAAYATPFVPVTSAAGFCGQNTFLGDIGGSTAAGGTSTMDITLAPGASMDVLVTALGAQTTPTYTLEFSTPTCPPAGACTGTPAPGNTISSVATACSGIDFNLSLENCTPGTGITYQWQSATSSTGPWTDIAGATSSTLTTNLTAATWYQCNVTCSGNTGTSNPVQVGLTPPNQCYCTPPASDCTDDDVILRVRISTLDNASTCGVGPPAGYTYYGGSVAAPTLYSGTANELILNTGDTWSKAMGVWIDYNQDGNFDASE